MHVAYTALRSRWSLHWIERGTRLALSSFRDSLAIKLTRSDKHGCATCWTTLSTRLPVSFNYYHSVFSWFLFFLSFFLSARVEPCYPVIFIASRLAFFSFSRLMSLKLSPLIADRARVDVYALTNARLSLRIDRELSCASWKLPWLFTYDAFERILRERFLIVSPRRQSCLTANRKLGGGIRESRNPYVYASASFSIICKIYNYTDQRVLTKFNRNFNKSLSLQWLRFSLKIVENCGCYMHTVKFIYNYIDQRVLTKFNRNFNKSLSLQWLRFSLKIVENCDCYIHTVKSIYNYTDQRVLIKFNRNFNNFLCNDWDFHWKSLKIVENKIVLYALVERRDCSRGMHELKKIDPTSATRADTRGRLIGRSAIRRLIKRG